MCHYVHCCQYLTPYRLLVMCHYVHCCLLQSVSTSHCTVFWLCVTMSTAVFYSLTVPHTVPSFGYVSLCPLLSFIVSPLSVSTSHCTVCWLCVTMSTAVFNSLSPVCQYFTPYHLLVMCHYVHCCLLQSVHCLSVPHTVLSVASVSLCPLLSSTVYPLSVYLTLYSLLVMCHYVHCCLLHSVHCLSVPHTVPAVGSVSLCPLLPSTFCPLSVSTSHCTVC